MSILNVNQLQPVGGGNTITVGSSNIDYSGSITGNISVDGNLTVTGVVSNEDVTNIDSVGLITARNGLQVTGGKVGVGINVPARLLHLHESNNNEALIGFTTPTTGATASDGFRVGMNGSEEAIVWNNESGIIKFGTANTERLRITSAGVVKIGSNTLITPSTDADNFVIDTGDVDSGLSILSATTGRIYFGDAASTDQGSIRYVHTDDSMRFETNSIERLRIDSSGNLLLKTGEIDIQGGNKTVKTSAGFLQVGTSGSHYLSLITAGLQRLNITSGGDVVIGNSSAEDGAHFQHYQSGARHQSFQSTNGDLAIVTDNNNNPAVYIKGTGTADLVKVFDNTTQVFTIKDGGNVEVNGNIVMGSGDGIDFSADPDASGRESELLDDYEHGTFTPTIRVESSGTTAAIDNVSGTYVKVGKLVYVGFHCELNGVPSGRSSSAAIEFHSMPFTSLAEGSSGIEEHIGSVRCHPVDNGTSLGACSEFIFRMFDNNTSGRIEARKSDGNLANASLYMRDNMQITAAITYRTAS